MDEFYRTGFEKYNRNHDKAGLFSSANTPSLSQVQEMMASPITSKFIVNGKLTPERRALHDKIVSGHLKGVPSAEHPTEYMNGGGPGSGKSSMTSGANAAVVKMPSTRGLNSSSGLDIAGTPHPGAVLIDPDAIKLQLPEVKAMRASGDTSWAGASHAESSYLANRIRRTALAKGVNIVNDGTGDSGLEKVLAKVAEAKAFGYRVEANYLYLEKATGIQRAEERAAQTGRHVPRHAIEAIYNTLPKIFPHLTSGVFDHLRVFDNNNVAMGEPARLIASSTPEGFKVLDAAAYGGFINPVG